ncbi:Cathepsin_L [Hexamita inflata]|uniref:Cathepsin L n=1 Tax=Hexamita inflata TaxID=28002 RepID=A0AA86TE73_9EUKA|nr:Cathepsin L [Hexamita inflata]
MLFSLVYNFRCNIISSDSLNDAYFKFLTCYSKNSSEQSQSVFNNNYQFILNNINCDVSENMDQVNTNSFKLQSLKFKLEVNCQQKYCYKKDPLQVLKQIYKSIDLREAGLITAAKNQGTCGSCWAFATIALLENNALQEYNANNIWKGDLDLSEQFFISNVRGFNDYCQGGEFLTAINYFQQHQVTVELETNYKYEFEKYRPQHDKNIDLAPIIANNDYMIPFQTDTEDTPVISLHLDQQKTFTRTDVKRIKSYLSRGIAVAAAMAGSNQKFSNYNGKSYTYAECISPDTRNHQVLFVGYGKINGVQVWILKNSWGQSWGDNGFFYIEQGKNGYCLEMYAFALIPRVLGEGIISNPGQHTSRQILDIDDGGLEKNNGSFQGYLILIISCIGIIGCAFCLTIWFIYKRVQAKH